MQKYAHASSAVVRLREDGDQLSAEAADDGRGFDVSTTTRGNGLTNMEDRLDAIGGTLRIAPARAPAPRAAPPFPFATPYRSRSEGVGWVAGFVGGKARGAPRSERSAATSSDFRRPHDA